jgi:hypothetical protein
MAGWRQGLALLAGARRCWPTHRSSCSPGFPGLAVLSGCSGRAPAGLSGAADAGAAFPSASPGARGDAGRRVVAVCGPHRFGGMPMPLAALAILLFCAFMALFAGLAGRSSAPAQGRAGRCGPVCRPVAAGRMGARLAVHRFSVAGQRLQPEPAQPAGRLRAGVRGVRGGAAGPVAALAVPACSHGARRCWRCWSCSPWGRAAPGPGRRRWASR